MSFSIYNLTSQQTNDGDWSYNWTLLDTDTGLPMWPGAAPVDLVVTMQIVPRDRQTVLTAKSTDTTGIVTVGTDSLIQMLIPAATMTTIRAGRYEVHLKFETLGRTIAQTIGYLPLVEGPK